MKGVTIMAKKGEIYKCDICGNVAYLLDGGDGDLVCCGQEMRLLNEEERKSYSATDLPKPGSP
jgi:desulfoferrodoxin-like iron-binding protein